MNNFLNEETMKIFKKYYFMIVIHEKYIIKNFVFHEKN
jgi:hypothetical protein